MNGYDENLTIKERLDSVERRLSHIQAPGLRAIEVKKESKNLQQSINYKGLCHGVFAVGDSSGQKPMFVIEKEDGSVNLEPVGYCKS